MRVRPRLARARSWALGAAFAGALLVPAPALGARGLDLGLTDGASFQSSDPETRSVWFDHAEGARADFVRLSVSWRSVAPAPRPPGFDPTDPGDPAYSWGTLDAAVRVARMQGLGVLIGVSQAPRWAEGKNRPSQAPAGSWKPDPGDLRQFSRAIAARFSGTFNPGGGALPAVRFWELWSEPNLATYLTPQWRDDKPFAPIHYRKMLNAFYAGINAVRKANVVLPGGTAPYGDPITGRFRRMRPAVFWRALLCLKGADLKPVRCRNPAHFDVAAHNPINVGAPRRKARARDDISTPDMNKLHRILGKAKRERNLRPVERKPLWATEIWWDSDPPDPDGVPEGKHARWLQESFYLLWKQRVRRVIWFQVRDAAPHPDFGFAGSFQTGLFLRGGEAKEAYRGYRFPFVGDRLTDGRVRIWGKAPTAGRVEIQRRKNGEWRTFERARAGDNHIFVEKVRLRGKELLRARDGSQQSLVWKQGG